MPDETAIKCGASDWVLAISPKQVDGFIKRTTSAHPQLRGYKITKPNLKKQLQNEVERYACGIYEWKATKTKKSFVVYIGSTCRGKAGNFIERIMDYCHTGSHKTDHIEDALKKEYQLWVSFRGSCGRAPCNVHCATKKNQLAAEKDENNLLEKYDYAWNIRNQDKTRIRRILD